MTINFATVLFSLGVKPERVEEMKSILKNTNELFEILCDSSVPLMKKEKVAKLVFDDNETSFILAVCRDGQAQHLFEIFDKYAEICKKKKGILKAYLKCVYPPTDEQKSGLVEFLSKKFNAHGIELEIINDDSLIGGFVLECEGVEFDRSIKRKLEDLRQTTVGEA